MPTYIVRFKHQNGETGTQVHTKLPPKNKMWMLAQCKIIEAKPTGNQWYYDAQERKLKKRET